MHEFRDSTGRVWHPHVTLRTIRDFEEQTGIGVNGLQQAILKLPAAHGSRLTFLACREQATQLGLDLGAFADQFTDQNDWAAVEKVMGQALADFFLKPPAPAATNLIPLKDPPVGPGNLSTK